MGWCVQSFPGWVAADHGLARTAQCRLFEADTFAGPDPGLEHLMSKIR